MLPWRNSWFQIAFFAWIVSGALLIVDYAPKIPANSGWMRGAQRVPSQTSEAPARSSPPSEQPAGTMSPAPARPLPGPLPAGRAKTSGSIKQTPVHVPPDVMARQLVNNLMLPYPPVALAARVSGSVVLHAIVSKTGNIEALTVVSGPALLRSAAIDSVKRWRYKPYLLNGKPAEVDTDVIVDFHISS